MEKNLSYHDAKVKIAEYLGFHFKGVCNFFYELNDVRADYFFNAIVFEYKEMTQVVKFVKSLGGRIAMFDIISNPMKSDKRFKLQACLKVCFD